MIREVKKYIDEKDGKTITQYTPIYFSTRNSDEGKACINNDERVVFEGQVGIQTPMGIAPIRFEFPEDYSLEKCFEKFEEIAGEEVERTIKEAEEKAKEDNLIVTPDQMKQAGGTIPFPTK